MKDFMMRKEMWVFLSKVFDEEGMIWIYSKEDARACMRWWDDGGASYADEIVRVHGLVRMQDISEYGDEDE